MMKKRMWYNFKPCCSLMVVALFASCLAACDDDDQWVIGDIPAKGQTATYSNKLSAPIGGNNLVLTYSGQELIGKDVAFTLGNDGKATLTLKGVLPGEPETAITGISLTQTDDGYAFSSSGTGKMGTTFAFSGKIAEKQLSLSLTDVKIPATSINGRFLPVANKDSESSTENVEGKRHRYTDLHQTLYLNTDDASLGGLELLVANVLVGPLLKSVLKDINFNEDGNIIASYAALPDTFNFQQDIILGGGLVRTENEWQASPLNLITYYAVNDTQLYVTPNIDMIIRQIHLDANSPATTKGMLDPLTDAYAQLNKWFTTGIKLKMKVNPRKEYYVYKETASMVMHRKYEGDYILYIDKEEFKIFQPVVKMFLPMLLTPEIIEQINQASGGILNIETLINGLLNAIESAETLEIGLYVNKSAN